MSTPITPDERAAMRRHADSLDYYYGEADAASGIRRLLDALETAEAEIVRLREDITPEALEQAFRDAGIVEVVAVHEGYGPEEVVHAHLDSVVDAVLTLNSGDSDAELED